MRLRLVALNKYGADIRWKRLHYIARPEKPAQKMRQFYGISPVTTTSGGNDFGSHAWFA
jgi:hypothetical protein